MQTRRISLYEYLPEVMDVIRSGEGIAITVTGSSMMPFLRDSRDRVLLQQKPRYRRGDVVLFTLPDGRYILHRIVRIQKDRMLTCGDGNIAADGWTLMENVLCAATRFERNGRIHNLESFLWRLLGLVWMRLFPIRPVLFKVVRRICKLYHRLFRRNLTPGKSAGMGKK